MGSQGSSRRIFSCSLRMLRTTLARSGAGLAPVSQGLGIETPPDRRLPTAPSCLPLFAPAGVACPP
jgi:hypothetical protein